MAPLVPDIIGNEFNFIIALIIGIGFGFVLEQAGFSSTKKLVGLFYGYDFTVLKVFFTAGVTAMILISGLSHLGLLNLELIYINPTFLWSALLGGAIMGGGFIIGGFCPGTSVCAAAIGKIDGMLFVLGSVFGIFIFTEGYPLFETIYNAENWGDVLMYDQLGMSRNLFAVLLTIVAVAAFFFTSRIENKVNKIPNKIGRKKLIYYGSLVSLGLVLLLLIVITPDKNERIQRQIEDAQMQAKCTVKEITSDKLAYELTNNYYKINLIDVRTPEAFEAYHLPLAINIPLENMLNSEYRQIFTQHHKINVFYADVETTAKMACLKARFIGKSQNFVLNSSTQEFKSMYFDMSEPLAVDASKEQRSIYNFRVQSGKHIKALEESLKSSSQPIEKKTRKVQGGCS